MLRKSSIIVKFAVLALVVGFYSFEARAAWGDLDPSFGTGGIAYDSVTNHRPRTVAIQPDGKILVTGYKFMTSTGKKSFFLRRYLANGALDTAFGSNGAAYATGTSDFTPIDYRGDAVVVHPNGKISVVGSVDLHYAVWQFTANGRADNAFGGDGLVELTAYPTNGEHIPEINSHLGKVLVTIKKPAGSGQVVVLVRLTAAGAFDPFFGNGGESVTDIDGYSHYMGGTVIESNDRITIGGTKFSTGSDRAIERKLSNGQSDLSFQPPTVYSYIPGNPRLVRMANRKYAMRDIYLTPGAIGHLALLKFSSAGVFELELRPIETPLSATMCPQVFARQSDGKLVADLGGRLYRTDNELTAGSVETTGCPGLVGINSTSFGALQPDDKIVGAGTFNGTLAVVRVMP